MTEFIEQFHFLRPLWLFTLLPALAIIISLSHINKKSSGWKAFIAPAFFEILSDKKAASSQLIPLYSLAIALLFIILALSGPTWEKKQTDIYEPPSALVILLDLSPSMNAEDIVPSRIQRARLKVIDLLSTHSEGLNALIAYSGNAHVVTPLTEDADTIVNLLTALEPGLMPSPGSNVEMAFELANKLLEDAAIQHGNIVLLTDGIADDARNKLREINQLNKHTKVFWGIGTNTGALIPLQDDQRKYARNAQGEFVTAKLDENKLREIALENGASYVSFSQNRADITALRERIHTHNKLNFEKGLTDEQVDTWYEKGPWLLLPCILIAAALFRRGWLLPVILVSFFIPLESYAFDIESLWLNQDQRAMKHLNQGDATKAAEHFSSSDWRAVALYRSEDYAAAAKHFAEGQRAEDAYNLGNSLAKLRDYVGAINAYELALERKPSLYAAEKNKHLLEALLQQLPSENKNKETGKSAQENSTQQGNNQHPSTSADQQASENITQDSVDDSSSNNQGEENDGASDNSTSAGNTNSSKMTSNADDEQVINNQKNESKNSLDDARKNQDTSADTSNNTEEEKSNDKPNEQLPDEHRDVLEKHYGMSNNSNSESADSQAENQQGSDLQDNDDHSFIPESPATMTDEQLKALEQQQSLEQWLRQVPDDPSGLMRKKFNNESKKQRMTRSMERQRMPPDQETRW